LVDLSRPLLLNSIQPAPEAILSGNSKLLQCINNNNSKQGIPAENIHQLLEATQFDQSKL
jgi:hypothetical protein